MELDPIQLQPLSQPARGLLERRSAGNEHGDRCPANGISFNIERCAELPGTLTDSEEAEMPPMRRLASVGSVHPDTIIRYGHP